MSYFLVLLLLSLLSHGHTADVQHFAAIGTTIELACPVGPAEQWDRITWERSNGRFLAVGRYYRIDEVVADDSGVYICRKLKFRPPFNGPRSVTVKMRLVVREIATPTPTPAEETEAPTTEAFQPEDQSTAALNVLFPSTGLQQSSPCRPNQVACGVTGDGQAPGKKCILKDWMCDGENDCLNNWDEQGCADYGNCRPQTFECKTSKMVIPMGYRCDGEVDCEGEEDENGCLPPSFLSPTHVGSVHQVTTPFRSFAPVRLTCIAQGQPKPTIIWRHNGRAVSGEHEVEETCEMKNNSMPVIVRSTLVLFTQMSDQGFYTCEATSGRGRAFSSDYFLRLL